jgi:hypothetical protein
LAVQYSQIDRKVDQIDSAASGCQVNWEPDDRNEEGVDSSCPITSNLGRGELLSLGLIIFGRDLAKLWGKVKGVPLDGTRPLAVESLGMQLPARGSRAVL